MSFKKYISRYSVYVFLLSLCALSLCYGYHKTIRYKPTSIHQWRQADCWSFAVNYYEENRNFFRPALHFIGESETGNASGEFPIIYYTVAQLWKIFGQKAWIFRGINIFIVFLGLLCLFKLFQKVVQDTHWALMLTLLLFTSPILVFYTNNFISDTPAFGFSLIGAWFFYKFYENQKNKNIWLACLFFLFGALLKVTAAMLFIAVLVIYIVETTGWARFRNSEKLFAKPISHGIPLLTVIVLTFAWYFYSAWYNRQYNGEYFLLGIWPVWRMDYPLINQVTRIINENLIYQFFSIPVIFSTGFMLVFLLVFREKVHKLMLALSLLLTAGGGMYMILWYRVFDVHDYYLLNLLIIVVAVMLTFFLYLRQNHPALLKSVRLKLFFLLFLCFNMYYARVKNEIKYNRRTENSEYSFLNRTNELDYWRWWHWYHETYLIAYESITPYLRSLGIERTDRVISINDPSPNISLALMDQKGVTDFGKSITDSARIAEEIKRGAKYLIINNPDYYQKDFIRPFTGHKLGQYKNLDIFSLKEINLP
ncbi:MAG: hypothetical protein BWY70_00439 [Bacteroidetes bacterium ADurb.Bin408]|nr:MAG: hypothetical protein BWY70_00439 [Bacteroidetes bacterium ADurb.Bin408]